MKNLPPPFSVIAQAIVDWWDELLGLVAISVVWVLCWLTVILGPPATFGLYYVTNQIAHREYMGLSGFVEGSRRYFFKSWLWMLLNLAALVLIVVNLSFYAQFDGLWATIVQSLIIALSVAWLSTQLYALPYLMEQDEKRLRYALRNGLLTALAAPLYTLIVMVLSVVALLLSILTVFPIIFGVPALVSAVGNRAVLERLDAFGIRE